MSRNFRCEKSDCFQNFCGMYCKLLSGPTETRPCPFYKTIEEAEKGRMEAHERLVQRKRFDLIEMYENNPMTRNSLY